MSPEDPSARLDVEGRAGGPPALAAPPCGGGGDRSQKLAPALARSAGLILLIAYSVWALNYIVVKLVLSEINPLAFSVLRYGLAGLVMAAVVYWRKGTLRVARTDMPLMLASAVFGITLNQVFFVYSLSDTGVGDVALLGATGPLLTATLATAVGQERLGRRHWLCALVGMVGVVMIVRGGVNGSFGDSSILGDGLALGATLCSSVAVLMDGRLLARYSAWHILTVQMLLGTGVLVPFALPALASQDYAHVTLGGWACLGYTIILSGVVANLLYFRGIDRIGPSRTVLFAYLSSVLGAVLAFVILHEHPTVLEVAGGIIVIASLLFNRPQVRSGRTPLWREVGRIATAVASTRSFWRARGRRGGTRHDASTLR